MQEYEELRNETLAEHMLIRLREMEKYSQHIKHFARVSISRGFTREIVEHALPLYHAKCTEMIDIAETAISVSSSSGKAAIMRTEIETVKSSLESFVKTIKELVMTIPTETENQRLFAKRG